VIDAFQRITRILHQLRQRRRNVAAADPDGDPDRRRARAHGPAGDRYKEPVVIVGRRVRRRRPSSSCRDTISKSWTSATERAGQRAE